MKIIIKINREAEVKIPIVPNFIRRNDGVTIDIADIDSASLASIADAFKSALIKLAEQRRNKAK